MTTSTADPGWKPCLLCERLVPPSLLTLHHLRPKQKGGKASDRVPFCKPCHKQVHALFSNNELMKSYQSVAALQTADRLQTFLEWVRRQRPDRTFRTSMANNHPSRSGRQRIRRR